DFVQGKGLGLVVNLHGPPGVGKTLTAEATSEVTESPLYIVGTSNLGTEPYALDQNLREIFVLAYRWKAIVVIDEADIFLEKRDSNDDVERNATVAVFLRQLEYCPGILFFTTSRASVFDEAMMSRVHVSLSYTQPDATARANLWTVFLTKADIPLESIERHVVELSQLPLTGRDIK
ncbi:P-loop containing nucleoside triphosphate hydrolase protein, partial [Gloeophyllum trabeum ATCC 11539]